MRKLLAMGVGLAVLLGPLTWEQVPAQEEGIAEQIGERIDRGVERLGSRLRKSWADIRQSIDELGVQGRVYSRLRWDKGIGVESIDVAVQERNVVVLTGTLPDEETRRKAVRLAEDTVGVEEVIDRLEIVPPPPDASETPSD